MPVCEMCDREVDETSQHHLIPQTRHSNKKNKKLFDRKEVKERKVDLCQPCHSKIHSVFTEKELERTYNTLEIIQSHPEIVKFIVWIQKHPTLQRSSSLKK